ncbi:hypothetical protein QFZ80_003010 [Paenibacillus sp. V4I7]|nr:hypothetical protein [Paenibacillus sp. V4I7]MDQ0914828.1 hypothetical protein [Paenibacillus sp. V4I5]
MANEFIDGERLARLEAKFETELTAKVDLR